MRDFGLGSPAFGDVLMGANPAAAEHRLVRNRYLDDRPGCRDPIHDFPFRHLGDEFVAISTGIDLQVSDRGPMIEQFEQRAAWLHDLGRQSVHLDVAVVVDDDPLLRIEHDEALHHVLEGHIDFQFPRRQLVVDGFECADCLIELRVCGLETLGVTAGRPDIAGDDRTEDKADD